MRSISVSSRFWTASAAVLILFGASGALAEGVQVNVDVPPMVAESTGRVTTTVSLAPVSLDRTGDPLDPLIICTELLEQPPTDDSSDVSQDFEVSLDDYDSFGADDFSVPAGVAWEIVRITIFGAAPSGDPDNADDVRCAIFDNGTGNVPDGVPGDPALWSDEFEPGLAGYQQFGTRDLLLYPSTAPVLGAGTYWLSCWVRMSSDPFGQWYWEEATSSTGFTAQWINPGDGYGTGAVDWTDIQTLGSTADDMAFELCGSITTVTTTTTTTTIPGDDDVDDDAGDDDTDDDADDDADDDIDDDATDDDATDDDLDDDAADDDAVDDDAADDDVAGDDDDDDGGGCCGC